MLEEISGRHDNAEWLYVIMLVDTLFMCAVVFKFLHKLYRIITMLRMAQVYIISYL